MQSRRVLMLAAVAALWLPVSSGAAILFQDNFDADHTANWQATNPAGSTSDVFFDYSTVGIPAAPGGVSTRGLKVQANLPGNGVLSGNNVSPLGLTLPAEYTLKFNMWQNT